jgi:hypothetical protein
MENNSSNTLDTTQPSGSATKPPEPGSTNPSKKIGHYIVAAFGLLFLLVFILPNSEFAQFLAFPIVILGGVSGIKFFVDAIISSKASNPFVRTFIILGGLGVGVVIFLVCLFAGAAVSFGKDPHPQHS